MGSVVSYLDYVYMENPEGQFVKEGLLQVQRSVVGVRQRTLEKNMETLRRGVSDRHNGHAGRTVMGMTVCCTRPFEDT